MKYHIQFFLAGAMLICAQKATAAAVDIIAPASASGVEGNSSQIPLDTGSFAARFQQVYSSSVFGGFPQGLTIAQVAFRPDAINGRDFGSSVNNVEIHLSTTSKAVDSLSPVFDLNVGTDDRIVVGGAPITLAGSGGHGVFEAWSVVLDFRSNQFPYNPAAGNLLLDIKVFSGASTSPFDAVDASGDSVSSVFGFGASIPSSGQASSLGLATFFAVQAVPEPSTIALFGFGGIVTLLVARKRTRQKGRTHEPS